MTKLHLYKFSCSDICCDTTSDKGKVTKYKEVFSIAKDENSAKIKAKLDDSYVLIVVKELGKDWYIYI